MNLPEQENTPIIIHLSDLHWGQDRRINEANGKLALDYLYEDLIKETKKPQSEWPNTLVITGDLTTKYAPKEYFTARKFIEKIRDLFHLNDNNICIVPGNHDVSLPIRRKYIKDNLPPYIYEKEFTNNLGPGLIKNEVGKPYCWRFYPKLRFCIFGFDSNMLDLDDVEKYPSDSDLFEQCLKCGRISKKQLEIYQNFWNTKNSEIPDFDTYTKIAVLHHHVIPIPSEELKPFNILTDAGSFLEKLTETDIDIILHGHEHFPFAARTQYSMAFQDESKEKDMVILGAGSAGADRLSYKKDVGNHYSIIRINNWNAKIDHVKIDIEWKCNKKQNCEFMPFHGLKPYVIKEKERMLKDKLRLEEARGYKLKKIKYDLIIKENGFYESTTEAHAVSMTRRLREFEHFLIFEGESAESEYVKPKIQHIGGNKVKEEPEIEREGNKAYLYVIPENPLKLHEETSYKFTEHFQFKGFSMSLEDPDLKHIEDLEQYFEFFAFQAVRSIDYLEIKITFPDTFIESMEKEYFCKATIGDERYSASDTSETKKIELQRNGNSLEMKVHDLIYSMNYVLCWYPPKKWPLAK